MLVIDPERLTALCLRLPEFGSLEIDGGRVLWVRSFVCTIQTLGHTLGNVEHGESVRVDRFPDGFKVRFWRTLATALTADDDAQGLETED